MRSFNDPGDIQGAIDGATTLEWDDDGGVHDGDLTAPRRGAGTGHVRHATAGNAGDHRGKNRVRLRRRHLGRRRRRQESPAGDVASRRGAEPVLLARRQAHRLHGQLRRQRRRLRHPRRGRRADAADLAPRRGRRPRLHARWPGPLQLAAGGLLAPAFAILHGGYRRRSPKASADPFGRHGGDLARRPFPGLYAARRALPAMEELPRRHGVADLGPQAG